MKRSRKSKSTRKKFSVPGPTPGGHVSPAIWTSAEVARELEKRQIAWINAEIHTRDLDRRAEELFDPDTGPNMPQSSRYNMAMGYYVRQKYKAGECEEAVREVEDYMRTGAWQPFDITDQIRKLRVHHGDDGLRSPAHELWGEAHGIRY